MFHRCVFDGDLDAAFGGDVWSGIDRLAEANEDVVLDLSGVDFIDSQGVGVIVSLIRRLSLKGLQLKVQACTASRSGSCSICSSYRFPACSRCVAAEQTSVCGQSSISRTASSLTGASIVTVK